MKKNVKLKEVKAYEDSFYRKWFLKLVYTYDDDNGKHEVTYPRVDLPFPQNRLPSFSSVILNSEDPYTDEFFIEMTGYECSNGSSLCPIYRGIVVDPRTNEQLSPCVMVDILVENKVHKMTLEEIEKKLGYKIELVSNK